MADAEHQEEAPRLSADQEMALGCLTNTGDNIFLTGCAGAGKSHVLHPAIEILQKRLGMRSVIITASTGVAAAHIGGITLHSFAGVGIDKITAEAAVAKMGWQAKNTWRNTQVLIVDEVSMLHGWFLTLLEKVGRLVREEPDLPMGGIRVVLVGDFLQLPPIKSEEQDVQFAFESEGWKRLAPRRILLTTDHRQSDNEFLAVLSEARLGALSEPSIQFLRARVIDTDERKARWLEGKPPPSYLFPRNADVDAHNERELMKLPGYTATFRAKDDIYAPGGEALKHLQAPELLRLRVGAEVMYLVNTSVRGGWFNGARGVITELDEKKHHIRMRLHKTGALRSAGYPYSPPPCRYIDEPGPGAVVDQARRYYGGAAGAVPDSPGVGHVHAQVPGTDDHGARHLPARRLRLRIRTGLRGALPRVRSGATRPAEAALGMRAGAPKGPAL